MKFDLRHLRIAVLLLLIAAPGSASTVTLQPVADNTLYQGNLANDPTGTFEDNSCGGGSYLFSGRTLRSFLRRSTVEFDIAGSIPAGSTVTGVTLTLDSNASIDTASSNVSLHAVTKDWGEGTRNCDPEGGGKGVEADPGDATWLDAKFQSVSWTTAGGDFGAASGTASVPVIGTAVWDSATSPGLVSAVQAWLDTPASNEGWILVGDETIDSTARRYDSREGALPPTLVVQFTPPANVYSCCAANGDCSLSDTATCTSQGGTPDTGSNTCEPNGCPQPVGACCNIEETCSDPIARDVCEAAGGTFQGAASACTDGAVDCGLEPFVDALPLPQVLAPIGTSTSGNPLYELSVVEASQQLHSELPPTDLWTYGGSFPGPTIEAAVGTPIDVNWINGLSAAGGHALAVDECPHGPNHWQDTKRVVTHLHGGHVPARFDGQPEFHLMPGESAVYTYPNDQLPATLWYHDHAMGITRLNVYMGLAGYYLLRDSFEQGLGLPSGEYELPLVLQDREFDAAGALIYPDEIVAAFFGDKLLVNGKVWPYHDVKRGKYRLRLLNGSQARVYELELEDLASPATSIPFQLIGTDGGLIDAPISLGTLRLSPAERMDVVVDFSGFSAGTEIVLKNRNPREPLVPNVMKFVVGSDTGHTGAVPGTLRPVTPIPEASASQTRNFQFIWREDECAGGQWFIRSMGAGNSVIGQHWDDLSEFPVLGDTEIWDVRNATGMMHPFHMHLVMFQVLDRTDLQTGALVPLEPWEIGTWKDTVTIPARMSVRVIAKFEDYPGRFSYHCHILDHEDHEMMRQYQAVHDKADCVVDGVCGPDEDCVSCPADCAEVSGALCGNGLCEIGDGEDCVSCPADCAGEQAGSPMFCCGDGDGVNPIASCGLDVDGFTVLDDRCTTGGFYCRGMPRLSACCGDALCEGQESLPGLDECAVDCTLPEPGQLPMLVAGITALGLLARRRGRASGVPPEARR